MPLIPFANNFLAGSLITLLIPVGMFIVIAIWFTRTARRVNPPGQTGDADAPAPTQAPSSGLATEAESPSGNS
jgi:hypothetical protein